MELRIKDYIIRPDNGSTFALSKEMTVKEWENQGNVYEWNTIYPKDLKSCILRIREDLRREDKTVCKSLDDFAKVLLEIDESLVNYIDEAIILFNKTRI